MCGVKFWEVLFYKGRFSVPRIKKSPYANRGSYFCFKFLFYVPSDCLALSREQEGMCEVEFWEGVFSLTGKGTN